MNEIDPKLLSRRKLLKSGLIGGAGAIAAGASWYALTHINDADGIPTLLRHGLRFNEALGSWYYSPARKAPEFPRERAEMPRVNGRIGLIMKADHIVREGEDRFAPVDAAAWRMAILDPETGKPVRQISLAEIQALPRVEMVTELKCVEGWSSVVHWSGFRFRDFAEKFGIGRMADGQFYPFAGLESIDKEYYVGMDTPSLLHDQTLLCDRMAGEPLTPGHGAPLRLMTTLKYGIKLIKQIGSLKFAKTRPRDYWHEQGYDWYAGH